MSCSTLELSVGLAAVGGEPNALFVAEVDYGEGGVVSHVARGPGAEGGFASFGLSDFADLAVVGILQKGGFLYVGYVDALPIRWEEHAVSFLLSFVDRGDGFPGNALIVEG